MRLTISTALFCLTLLSPAQAADSETARGGIAKLSYEYFEGNWEKLPDFSKLEAKKSGNLETALISNELLQLRERDDQAYYALVRQRAAQDPYRKRRMHVEARLSRDEATFMVRDEGVGFDPGSLPDPTDPANLEKASGRGVLLMRTFMDEVEFNDVGNEVKLTKKNPLSS